MNKIKTVTNIRILVISTKLVFFLQYFADRDIFCAGRVTEEDLRRVAAATGGTVQTSVNNVIDEVSMLPFLLYISHFRPETFFC